MGLPVLMGVDLQGYREPGMPEYELGVAGRDLQVLEQGRRRVAQVMHLDDPEPVGVADAAEGY